MKILPLVCVLALSFGPLCAQPASSGSAAVLTDASQIIATLKKQFDQPDAPLTVVPVTVVGDYAVAGWIQGKKGGRALLQKEQGQWRISVCAGDGLTQASVLETTGMQPVLARKLANAVGIAEAKLTAEQRRLFASFQGMLTVNAASGHGHHAK